MTRPRVVLMLGEPGSGKTVLGTRLARALRMPFLARDEVRGGLYVTRGAWGDHPVPVPTADEAVAAFLTLVETLAARGRPSLGRSWRVGPYVARWFAPFPLTVSAGNGFSFCPRF